MIQWKVTLAVICLIFYGLAAVAEYKNRNY